MARQFHFKRKLYVSSKDDEPEPYVNMLPYVHNITIPYTLYIFYKVFRTTLSWPYVGVHIKCKNFLWYIQNPFRILAAVEDE